MTLSELRSCIQLSKLNNAINGVKMTCSYCGQFLNLDSSLRCVCCGANYGQLFTFQDYHDVNLDFFDIDKYEENCSCGGIRL